MSHVRTLTREDIADLTFTPYFFMDRDHFRNFASSSVTEFLEIDRHCVHNISTGKLVCAAFILGRLFKQGFIYEGLNRDKKAKTW